MLHHRPPRTRRTDPPGAVPRRRVLALIIGGGGILALLVIGLVLSLISAVDGPTQASAQPAARTSIRLHESPSVMSIPLGRSVGAQGVTTGYPHTVQGAVAQLAAIDVAVLTQPRSQAVQILRAWSLTRPSTGRQWTILSAIDEDPHASANHRIERALPAMARVVPSQAPQRHSVCLVLHGRAGRALAHCEAMVWDDGRWVMDALRAPVTSSKLLIAAATAPFSDFQVLQVSELW